MLSLLVTVLLLHNNLSSKKPVLYRQLQAFVVLGILGVFFAYGAGSSRDRSTVLYMVLVVPALLAFVLVSVAARKYLWESSPVKRLRRELDTIRLRITQWFRLQDDEAGTRAGDAVLLYNYPRRYKAFFYCNSASFMLSISLIILLVTRNLYRPAIRSNALSVCTAVGTFGLVGAFAAGSTQHRKTSSYIMGRARGCRVGLGSGAGSRVLGHQWNQQNNSSQQPQ